MALHRVHYAMAPHPKGCGVVWTAWGAEEKPVRKDIDASLQTGRAVHPGVRIRQASCAAAALAQMEEALGPECVLVDSSPPSSQSDSESVPEATPLPANQSGLYLTWDQEENKRMLRQGPQYALERLRKNKFTKNCRHRKGKPNREVHWELRKRVLNLLRVEFEVDEAGVTSLINKEFECAEQMETGKTISNANEVSLFRALTEYVECEDLKRPACATERQTVQQVIEDYNPHLDFIYRQVMGETIEGNIANGKHREKSKRRFVSHIVKHATNGGDPIASYIATYYKDDAETSVTEYLKIVEELNKCDAKKESLTLMLNAEKVKLNAEKVKLNDEKANCTELKLQIENLSHQELVKINRKQRKDHQETIDIIESAYGKKIQEYKHKIRGYQNMIKVGNTLVENFQNNRAQEKGYQEINADIQAYYGSELQKYIHIIQEGEVLVRKLQEQVVRLGGDTWWV